MGIATFSSVQVATASDTEGLQKIEKLASHLGLNHSGIIELPINRYSFLVIYPSGSKAFWPEDEEHLAKLDVVMQNIADYNDLKGGNYLSALQSTIREKIGSGQDVLLPPRFIGDKDYNDQ